MKTVQGRIQDFHGGGAKDYYITNAIDRARNLKSHFDGGGGGAKDTHEYGRGVQGPLKSPGSSRVFWCSRVLSEFYF